MIDKRLLLFTCKDPDGQPGLRYPFVRDGWIYATDAKGVARMRTDEPDTPLTDLMPPKAWGLKEWEQFPLRGNGLREFPSIEELKPIPCRRCKGEGALYSCPDCNGDCEFTYTTKYGKLDFRFPCPLCQGYGSVTKDVILTLEARKESLPMIVPHTCGACLGQKTDYEFNYVSFRSFIVDAKHVARLGAAGVRRFFFVPKILQMNEQSRWVAGGAMLFEADNMQGIQMVIDESKYEVSEGILTL
jgi:hypothetical protein